MLNFVKQRESNKCDSRILEHNCHSVFFPIKMSENTSCYVEKGKGPVLGKL